MADYGVYLVTDTAQCGERGVVETVRQAVDGGVRTVQIRDKHADAATFLKRVLDVAAAVGDRATVLVNDRVDVYLAARSRTYWVHGVHIGQSDLPAVDTRRIIGPNAVLGLTANTTEHFAAAAAMPTGTVDYLGVGVIRPTTTKANHPKPRGVDGFSRLAQSIEIPCVAIGGVGVDDVSALHAAGAAGVAVVSAICRADEPCLAAKLLTQNWNEAPA